MLIDDDVIDFANKEMSNVVLSLDGRKEINDQTRVDYAGKGSYDRIVPKFQKLVEARGGKNYYMRGTFTHAKPGLHQRRVPHGRSGLYRAEHGAGGLRSRRSRRPDAGGSGRS